MLDAGSGVDVAETILGIVRSQPAYAALLPDDWDGRVMRPAIAAGKARLLCDDRAFVIWCRPKSPPHVAVSANAFFEDGPLTWVIDIVGVPGVPAIRIGREVYRVMTSDAGMKKGQRALFFRTRNERIGYCTARA
jgi:hypothetical protein